MEHLLKKSHIVIEILRDKTIKISGPPPACAGNVGAICGCNEPSRDYATSWYSDNDADLAVHIYISSSLKSRKTKMLDCLAPFLESCNSINDIFNLNGKRLTTR